MALFPLTRLGNVQKVIVSTYQAASGAGKKGLDELETQTHDYATGKEITKLFWKKQYIHNVFSHNSDIDKLTLYNKEELKIINESKKILHNENIIIDPTCVRVPVLQSHCISFNVEFDKDIEMNEIINAFETFSGIKVENNIDDNEFPEPIKSSNTHLVSVGRIRHYPENYKNWSFFVSGDQLLKGAAYNSVQILEKILIKKLI
jgi:aspartate-semialdehyde dehydrogenase